MSYYLGIDGGGTKTVAILSKDDGTIIDTARIGPTNYKGVGIEKTKDEFWSMFKYFFSRDKVSLKDIKSLCLGGAGVDFEEDKEILKNMFYSLGYKNKILIFNDSVTTLVGANGEKKGAILISGTGSVAYGIDLDNNPIRVGGWGHFIDDLGSGFAIGKDALSKIMESYDGRCKQTILWEKVSTKLQIKSHDELISFIYNPKTNKNNIAEIAVIVIDSYLEDDVAKEIIDKAVEDLFIMVKTLSEKMNCNDFPLSFSGSVLVKSPLIRKLLEKRIKKELPQIVIHDSYNDGAYGALILALENS
ncbi:N-acetylglucosamine kinase [Clostridium senegalense]|uniref:N-acetylglucosamine kinase n=1 Tax=Clostridium senegalense TaxID=1465809 RepID=UPI00028839DD|nr:BadF/BadG/BcrA/BcrD ATPase family protein [Clostridium senegalense]